MEREDDAYRVGCADLLLEASEATTAHFCVERLSDKTAARINALAPQDRWEALAETRAKVTFERWGSRTFECNLAALDDGLPEIVAQLFLTSACHGMSAMFQTCLLVERKNPRHYEMPSSLYAIKIRRFLRELAFGMRTEKPWAEYKDLMGDRLFVRESKTLVTLAIYDSRHLFHSTRFGYPSPLRLRKVDGKWRFFLSLSLYVRP